MSGTGTRPASTGDVRTLLAVVHGRVQGVGFREYVVRHARTYGVSGWVRNLPDGRSVEVRASGSRAALASLLNPSLFAGDGALAAPHFAPKAKRVIYLFMSGGPSHIDLFDYKPKLKDYHGQELPGSVRMGQRITGMTSNQSSFPCVAPMFKFAQHGKSGAWVSELMPNVAKVVDDIAIVKSVNTEAINHDPATTYIQTGSQQPGRPSLGAWLSYGLGSENQDLPAFIVLI